MNHLHMKTPFYFGNFIFLTLFLLFTSCTDQSTDISSPMVNALKITASKQVIEPFDIIVLRLNLSKEEIQQKYDSIFWIGDGDASNPIHNELDSIVIINNKYVALKKCVTDYRIGKHKVFVKTYKNNIASLSDSIEFVVSKPTGDFLSFNWSEKEVEYLYFTPNLTQKRINFGTYLWVIKSFDTNKYPSVRFEFWGWSADANSNENRDSFHSLYDTKEERNTIRQFYHNYITELYGKSTLLYEDSISQSPLRNEYEKRFNTKIVSEFGSADYPLEIWDTPTAHIALISLGNDDYRNTNWYKVIAEPRKF